MTESAPEGFDISKEPAVKKENSAIAFLRAFAARLREADAGTKQEDFTRQRGIGKGIQNIELEEKTVDGLTPRQAVKIKLDQLQNIKKD